MTWNSFLSNHDLNKTTETCLDPLSLIDECQFKHGLIWNIW
jgi:hypothetical protein